MDTHNHMFKTSLLKNLKIIMDLMVASSLHGNKITAVTARSLVYMLVLVTTEIKQIHGWIEHYKINKSSLLIILKRGTDH